MSTEPAVLPPPTGAPAAPLPPPVLAAPAVPTAPFLPTVAAPSRPAAPRPAIDMTALTATAPTVDTAAPPSWKQQRKGSSLGRTVKLLVVLCLVVGASLGVFAYTQRPDDSDLPVAEMQPTEGVATDVQVRGIIDQAQAVVGQNGSDAAPGTVTADGRVTFTTAKPALPNHDFQAPATPDVTIDTYAVQGPDFVLVMVMRGPTSLMAAPQASADGMAAMGAANAGVTVTSTSEVPVAAGRGFAYQMTGEPGNLFMRVLIADDTAVAIIGTATDGSEPPDIAAIWNTITFDGVHIV